jgi:sugar diacid utilization regulator
MTLDQILATLPDAVDVVAGDAAHVEVQRVLEAPRDVSAALAGTIYLLASVEAARSARWLAQRRDIVLVAPITAARTLIEDGSVRATIVAVPADNVPLDLSARIQRALLEADIDGHTAGSVAVARQDLVDDVLHQRFQDPHAVLTRARHLGVELESSRVVLVAAIDDFERFYLLHAGEGEGFIMRLKGALSLLVRREIQRHDPRGTVVAIGDAVIGLLGDEASAKAAAAAIAEGARRELRLVPVAAATGASKDSWTALGASYREARLALEMRRRLRLTTKHVAFADVTGAALLQLLAGAPEVVELLAWELGPLIEADRAHRTRLVETLAAYLDAGSSLKRAAEALNVHPKTLRYRLDRIGDLLGRDALDGDKRLLHYLAAKWWLWVQD